MQKYLPKNIHWLKKYACSHSLNQADMQSRVPTYIRVPTYSFTYEYIQIQSNLRTHFDFYNANVASRDLQRNASFQPNHLHHLAMLFIFGKIKKGDKQFFNMSVDLPNEFSNGIKVNSKLTSES